MEGTGMYKHETLGLILLMAWLLLNNELYKENSILYS